MKFFYFSLAFFVHIHCLFAQEFDDQKINFADIVITHSSVGYFQYSGNSDIDIVNINYWDNQGFLSLNTNFALGLYFNKIWTSDFYKKNKLHFYRVGPIVKYQEYAYNGSLIFFMEASLSYGNFVINLNDQPEKRNLLFLGGSFGIDWRIYSKLYLSGGFRISRQIEKGDYGLENYPFLGLTYRFRKLS